jgi:cell division protein FtsA
MDNQIIFSLDVGGSKIVSIAGTIGENIQVNGVSCYYYISNSKNNDFLAINNGAICDLEFIHNKAHRTLNEARINADCSTGGVVVNVSGNNLCSHYAEKSIEINNQVISAATMQQLVNEARQIRYPAQYEILDYEVQEYVLDDENYAINPINLTANKISSNVNVFLANSAGIDNTKKVLKNTGFELAKLVPSGILSGLAVLNHEEKELGCCLIDIGAGTTDIVVYENGFIRYLTSIPVGGERITRDIASVLKISRNLAEDIKITYGGSSYATTNTSQHKFGEGIHLTDHRGVNTTISRKLLVDVITERLKEIFETIKTTLGKEQLYDIINSGMIITGGVSLLPNIEDFARHIFDLPVKVGMPRYSGDFEDIVVNPRYATSIGSLYFAHEYMQEELKFGRSSNWSLKEKLRNLFR